MYSKRENEKIMMAIEKIRGVIADHQTSVDLVLDETAQDISKLSQKYRPEFLQAEIEGYQEAAKNNVHELQKDAFVQVNFAFSQIREQITAWINEPVPDALANLIGNARQNNLKMSATELLALSRSAASSYFGLKSLNQIATEQHLMFPNFRDLDSLYSLVTRAEYAVKNVIKFYCGQSQEDGKVAMWLLDSQDVQSRNAAGFSMDFLTRRTALDEMSETLLSLTDPGISLVQSEKDRLAALFADCEDEDAKVNRMLALIENKHTNHEDESILRTFDQGLYKKALVLKRDNARQAQKSIERVVRDTQEKALKARTKVAETVAQLADA